MMTAKKRRKSSGNEIAYVSSSSSRRTIQKRFPLRKKQLRASTGNVTTTPPKLKKQTTLTQIDFATPLRSELVIPDSEDDESEEEGYNDRPPKRRRMEVKLEHVKRQSTLTQIDFVTTLGRSLDEDEDEDGVNEMILEGMGNGIPYEKEEEEEEQEEAPELDTRSFSVELGQAFPNNPLAFQATVESHIQKDPSTPKQTRVRIVQSSQTPPDTPNPPDVEQRNYRVANQTSPKHESRWQTTRQTNQICTETLLSTSQSGDETSSEAGELSNEQGTSPTTRRVLDFNARYAALSRSGQTRERADERIEEDWRRLGAVHSSTDKIDLTSMPISDETETNVRATTQDLFAIGDETQAAFLKLGQRLGSNLGPAIANPDIDLDSEAEDIEESAKGTTKSAIEDAKGITNLVRSVDIDLAGPFPYLHETSTTSSSQQGVPKARPCFVSTGQQSSRASTSTLCANSSPVPLSQATTVSCTPVTQRKHQTEDCMSTIKKHSAISVLSSPTAARCSRMDPINDDNVDEEEEAREVPSSIGRSSPLSESKVDVTVSQLLPDSLFWSSIPMPPPWTQMIDHDEL